VIELIIPFWFALLVGVLVMAPAIGMSAGAAYLVHFTYLKIFKPFRWKRKNIHLL